MYLRFLRFILVGLAATTVTFSALITGVEVFHTSAVTASLAGYALGIVVNYSLNYGYTFKSRERHMIVIPRFLLIMFAGLLINALIMVVLVDMVGVHYVLAQLAAISVVLVWNFTANQFWTFAR